MSRQSMHDFEEICCGTTCDKDKMEVQQKLLGVQEFVRLYKAKVVLTDAQKHCIDVMATVYKMTLIPLK